MDADVPLAEVLIRSAVFIVSFLARSFFAAAETAFLSMDKWAIEGLADNEDRRARMLSSPCQGYPEQPCPLFSSGPTSHCPRVRHGRLYSVHARSQ
jgi:hypothetical protein